MTRRYLIVDDDLGRFDGRYKPVATRVRGSSSDIVFTPPAYAPSRAIEILSERGDEFSGVLADCDLNATRADVVADKQVRVEDSGGRGYMLSTGLGVLDWVHRNLPGVATWALIDTSATHAPLYTSAASLWLGAKPMDVNRFRDTDEHVANLVAELDNPRDPLHLNPLWPVVKHSTALFDQLMNKTHQGVETLDWLGAMATLTRRNYGPGGFTARLGERLQQITGREITVHRHRLAAFLAGWQVLLAEMYYGFSIDDEVISWDDWPMVDEAEIRADRRKQDLSHWTISTHSLISSVPDRSADSS